MKGGPFGDIQVFRKKVSESRKKGSLEVLVPTKIGKGDPSSFGLEWFLYFML